MLILRLNRTKQTQKKDELFSYKIKILKERKQYYESILKRLANRATS